MRRKAHNGSNLFRGRASWIWTSLAAASSYLLSEQVLNRLEVARLARQSQALSAHLAVALARPLESLHALRALFQTPGLRIHEAEFVHFSGEALKRYPEIAAFEWFPFVKVEERSKFESFVQDRQPGYRIWGPQPAADNDLHIPLTYVAPPNPAALGLDLAQMPNKGQPARQALLSQKVTASDRCQLVEDPEGELSVVTYAPVDTSTWAADSESEPRPYGQGVVALIFRLEPLVSRALAGQDLSELAIVLEDSSAPEKYRNLLARGTFAGPLRVSAQVAFADRVYELSIGPSRSRIPWFSLGLAFSVAAISVALVRARALKNRAKQLSQTLETLGQYELEELIATGGMGTVYRARHALLKRPAAIKIAHKDQSSSHFEREARIHSTLTHPNTVTVFDFGRGEDGTFYVAMEYVEGYDLYRLVNAFGPIPAARAARILIQAAASLEEAHARGLVHRDVKPSNIMLTERGGIQDFVKLLDFGLARSQVPTDASLRSFSASTLFVGTPGYIAPEVIAGAAASPASDIFSLGCVAFFLVAGHGPFDEPSPVSVLARVVAGRAHPYPAQTPRPFSEFIERCLQRRPEDRPLGMTTVGEQLRATLPLLPPWTSADSRRFWQEHPPQHHAIDQRAFSVALRKLGSGGESQSRGTVVAD